MTDKDLLEEIHYSEKYPTRAADLYKKIAHIKKEIDEVHQTIRIFVMKQYKL